MAEPEPNPPLPVLLSDQASRWQRGERVRVEDYLRRYPRLSDDEEALLDLVYAEAVLAERSGETINVEDYASRFPRLRERLRRQFAVHQAAGFSLDEGVSSAAGAAATTPEVGLRGGAALPSVPGYELIDELGRGGMGVVYLARQLGFNRPVALKMIRGGSSASREEVARFRVEAEAVGRLGHANIVQVYAFGEHEGLPYYAMEFLPGGSLARRLAQGPLREREAARLIEALAHGVEAAHQAGVVHRDLKPGNVLLATEGTPKVSDFGLAKLLDAERGHTHSDVLLGTAEYMAPEAASGRVREIGPAADVYALGAILYECLTGRPPLRGRTKLETLELVRTREPVPPGKLRPGLSPNLEAICQKCLEKEPEARYATAEALANDLGRWLRGEHPDARPTSWLRRQWRRVRRHPRVAAAGVFGVLVLAVGMIAAATWPMAPAADPEREIRTIEARLARGEKVELIGDAEEPKWFLQRQGAEQTRIGRAVDGAFAVHARVGALVELVRDPQVPRFRLSAEVRHESTDPLGEVGLYAGHREHRLGQAGLHIFVQASYNDIYSKLAQWKRLPPNAGTPRPKGNQVELLPRIYSERGRGVDIDTRIGGIAVDLFEPGGLQNKLWRRLTVEVRPGGVKGFWCTDPPQGKQQYAGMLKAAEIAKANAAALASHKRVVPGLAGLPANAGQWAPRGAVGLYVLNSSASFRRVWVEPLGEAD